MCSDAGPVPLVRALVAMVVRVVIASPHVVGVADVALVRESPHLDVGEDVLQLWVVVERDGSERVEVVGVHGLRLAQNRVVISQSGLLLALGVGFVGAEVEANDRRVDKEVGAPSHATHSAQSVSSAHFQSIFNQTNYLIII